MKKGFTLVELSIVLVIIGLLIGGILVGQSLINASKINKVIRQISEYDIAISAFKGKYKSLPGDTNVFPSVCCGWTGFKDGGITNAEVWYAWNHLSLGVGLKNKFGQNYPTYSNSASLTANECPQLDLDQDKTQGRCLSLTSTVSNNTSPIVYRYISGGPGNAPTIGPLLPVDVLAIDQKIDDGIANTGNVYHSAIASNNCADGGVYSVNSSAFGCYMYITINTTNNDYGRR